MIAALPSIRNASSSEPNRPWRTTRAPVATSNDVSCVPAHSPSTHPAGSRAPTHQISLVLGRHSALMPSNSTVERFSGSAIGHHASELAPPSTAALSST